jgi:hypothetical protein
MSAMSLIVIFLLAWLAVVVNEWFPVLRLESPTYNAMAVLGAYALPWLALILAVWRLYRWRRIATLLALGIPIAYTLIFGPMVVMHLMKVRSDHGRDRSFQRVAAVPVDGGGRIAIYRSDCGLPCGNEGIAVRHERRLLRGLLLVRRLDGFEGAHDARHDVIGPRRVRVSIQGPGPARSRVYDVKPWVYF